jgi:hypothetical protein
MPCTTITEIRAEAGFTDNTYTTDSVVEAALTSAQSEIDGIRTVTGYTLPVTASVLLLSTIARMLGARHLLTREYGTGTDGTSKDGQALKKDARAMLNRI